ncbi:MAG: hypothetical protein MEQ07_04205 [Aquimonas sp.]|nr:hypothetical protein [Aquimonas sp.]
MNAIYLDPSPSARLLALLGFLGALLFGAALLASLLFPVQIERAAGRMLAAELESRARATFGEVQDTRVGALAQRLMASQEARIAELRARLESGLPQRIDAVVAEMRDPDCSCRSGPAASFTLGTLSAIASLEQAQQRLAEALRGQYRQLADKLHREFRIFSGSNALVFLLLGLAAVYKRRAGPHLLPSAVLLVLATLIVAGFYLFGQDWLRTILFDDYLGFGYVAWIGVVCLPLADVWFNQGRVMTSLLNAIGEALGSTVEVCTC